MARADRLERLDVRRVDLEQEYFDALTSALRVTAEGSWGLFDHQQHPPTRKKLAPVIENLTELAEAIDDARDQLGLEAYPLHQEFLASRGRVPSNAVGEPKQAQAWLDRLSPPEV